MKRAFLAFALVVTLVASLAACSSRPADNNGSTNNGTSNSGTANNGTSNSGTSNSGTANSGTANNGTANSGTANSGTANSGTASSGTDIAPGDDAIIEDGIMDEGTTDEAIIGENTIPPVIPSPDARSATRRAGAYYADLNGNLADWDDEATIGDAARTAVDGVMNSVRRAGAAVGDTLKGDR